MLEHFLTGRKTQLKPRIINQIFFHHAHTEYCIYEQYRLKDGRSSGRRQMVKRTEIERKNITRGTDDYGVHIAQCERTLYFVNVLHEIQENKKGPTFR
jgi:hypothetical protein